MQTIRTFIAIELSSPVQGELANLQNRLKTVLPPRTVRWVPVGNIHLTLHFLGDIPVSQTDRVINLLQTATAQIKPFSLQLTGLGCFPNLHRPRVIWTGVQGQTAPLNKLYQTLGKSLKAIDFSPDNRPYSPHLTIGRVNKQLPTRQSRQLAEALQKIQPEIGNVDTTHVTAISLMQSQLKPTGAVYTCLGQGNCAG